MKNITQIVLQLVLTTIIFGVFYYAIDASTSVKAILAYIIALGFSKAWDRQSNSTDQNEILEHKEKIEELEQRLSDLENTIQSK
jgi:hypothetical protein